jgi:hypothetical protein
MFKINLMIYAVLLLFVSLMYGYPGKIVKEYPAPAAHSTGMTFDGKYLWVADHKEDSLYCLDPKTGKVQRSIPSPGFWPMGLAWDGTSLWNVDSRQKKIFEVNPASGAIIAAIDAPSDNPEGLTWDGKTLWVSDSRENSIMKIDLSDGTALQTFSAPSRTVQDLTFDGRYLWSSDRLANELYMIDPSNGEAIIMCEAPAPYPRGLTWDGHHLWNVDYQTDKIYQLVRKDNDLYHLENTRNAQVTVTHQVKTTGTGKLLNLDVYFAIPGNLNQQKILSVKFNHTDYNVVEDHWKQKFAHFNYQNLISESNSTSVMTVQAEISEIRYFIFPDECGSLSDIPADINKRYTADGSKYEIYDPFIQEVVRKKVGNEKNPYWIARKIFDYVRNTLEYKLEGGWNVAPFVLKRGTGSCSEYTFSFISLCRAAGLPARYVGAIMVRGDDASLDEVFHRWPEVYLPNYGWIPIDPQGGDKPTPSDRLNNIGHLSNRPLITTQGGGDSEYMGWYYNTYEKYETDPQIQVNIETFGDWQPME